MSPGHWKPPGPWPGDTATAPLERIPVNASPQSAAQLVQPATVIPAARWEWWQIRQDCAGRIADALAVLRVQVKAAEKAGKTALLDAYLGASPRGRHVPQFAGFRRGVEDAATALLPPPRGGT